MDQYASLINLLKKDRSYRRFDASKEIDYTTLLDIVEAVRYTPSGRNFQPLSYLLIVDKEMRDKIFPTLGWAGYLSDWSGPSENERPTAYIIQCLDTCVTDNYMCDDGLQLEALTLAATSLGLGCCIIKSFNPKTLAQLLTLDERYTPLHVVAIGRPIEKVVLETLPQNSKNNDAGNIRYRRDDQGVHYVPKRPLEDIIIIS